MPEERKVPTEPGYWWVSIGGQPESIARVGRNERGILVAMTESLTQHVYVGDFIFEWLEPVTPRDNR